MPLKVKRARALLPSLRVPSRLPTKGQDRDPRENWMQMNREPGRLEQNPQELLVPWQRQVGKQDTGGCPWLWLAMMDMSPRVVLRWVKVTRSGNYKNGMRDAPGTHSRKAEQPYQSSDHHVPCMLAWRGEGSISPQPPDQF